MKCYNHPEREGVAICRACGKALCHDCATETEAGFACPGKCTDSLLEDRKIHTELGVHLRKAKRASRLGSLFSVGMGLLFILFSTMGYGLVYNFILFVGIGFTVYGFVALLVDLIIFIKHGKNRSRNRSS